MIIDRFESNLAVCEDMKTRRLINVDMSLLPPNPVPGDIIVWEEGKISIDHKESDRRRERLRRLHEKLKRKK
ncbi:MAG: DUF3006 domain-containing protein [Clostridiales bacterium]|nr:DUF3006 domain-containing protein [Clostridiales bacterium]